MRVAAALCFAIGLAVGVLWLETAIHGPAVLVNWVFMLVLPAVINAVAAYIGDPFGERPLSYYLLTPPLVVIICLVLAALALREGVICLVIAAPVWMGLGCLGTYGLYRFRRWRAGKRVSGLDLFVLPLTPFLAMIAEPALPPPAQDFVVSRSVVVAAPPQTIWPLAEGVGKVGPDEGCWNLTQSLLGVPRPRSAQLRGTGLGAPRRGEWTGGIGFDEVIDLWRPGREIAWRFDFGGSHGWGRVDEHLRPDGPVLQVRRGGYRLTPLADGRTRLELWTAYRVQTSVNGYASLWGELLLGDIETNVLTIIRRRAEGA